MPILVRYANLSQKDFEVQICKSQEEVSKFVDTIEERKKQLSEERLLIFLEKAKTRANVLKENEKRSSEMRSLDGECSLGVIAKDLQKIDDLLNNIAAFTSSTATVAHATPVKIPDTSIDSDFDSETVVPSSSDRTPASPPPSKDCFDRASRHVRQQKHNSK